MQRQVTIMRTATTTKTVRTNTAPPVAMLTIKRILRVELGALLVVLGVGLVDVAILLLLVLLVMAVTLVDDEAVVIVVAAKRKKSKITQIYDLKFYPLLCLS